MDTTKLISNIRLEISDKLSVSLKATHNTGTLWEKRGVCGEKGSEPSQLTLFGFSVWKAISTPQIPCRVGSGSGDAPTIAEVGNGVVAVALTLVR
jgi:hypothetical protein